MTDLQSLLSTVHLADIFELGKLIPDESIDMIPCDLPYNVTACKWDNIIPLEPMWELFRRIIKPNGVIALTAVQPFTSQLVMSNLKMFKYAWIWEKGGTTGFLNAKHRPLRVSEDVLIFSKNKATYHPQMTEGEPYQQRKKIGNTDEQYGKQNYREQKHNEGYRYPTTIIKFNYDKEVRDGTKSNKEFLHPTQKPLELIKYLIETHTKVGDIVFDPCCGSGTVAVACRDLKRNYIVGDITPKYVELTNLRLSKPYTPTMFNDDKKNNTDNYKQEGLF